MAERSPPARRRLLFLIAAVVAAVAFVADARISESAVPSLPPPCAQAADAACNEERNAVLGSWRGELFDLEAGLEVRYWLYAAVFTLAVFGIAALGPRREEESLATIADDLGVVGVAWLAFGVIVLVVADATYVDVPAAPVILPAAAFVAAAAVGRLATLRRQPEPRRAAGPLGPSVPIAGLVITALAVLLAGIVILTQSAQGECGVEDSSAVDILRDAAVAAGAVAALLGLAALFGRRWVLALICVTVGPIAAIFALLAGVCLD